MMVPSQISALLNSPAFRPERLSSMEAICSVGAAVHREHKDSDPDAAGRFYELYGCEGFITILDKNDYATKPDRLACPSLFEMRITCEGSDAVAGEVVRLSDTVRR